MLAKLFDAGKKLREQARSYEAFAPVSPATTQHRPYEFFVPCHQRYPTPRPVGASLLAKLFGAGKKLREQARSYEITLPFPTHAQNPYRFTSYWRTYSVFMEISLYM